MQAAFDALASVRAFFAKTTGKYARNRHSFTKISPLKTAFAAFVLY